TSAVPRERSARRMGATFMKLGRAPATKSMTRLDIDGDALSAWDAGVACIADLVNVDRRATRLGTSTMGWRFCPRGVGRRCRLNAPRCDRAASPCSIDRWRVLCV